MNISFYQTPRRSEIPTLDLNVSALGESNSAWVEKSACWGSEFWNWVTNGLFLNFWGEEITIIYEVLLTGRVLLRSEQSKKKKKKKLRTQKSCGFHGASQITLLFDSQPNLVFLISKGEFWRGDGAGNEAHGGGMGRKCQGGLGRGNGGKRRWWGPEGVRYNNRKKWGFFLKNKVSCCSSIIITAELISMQNDPKITKIHNDNLAMSYLVC